MSAVPSLVLLTLDFPPDHGGVQQLLFELANRLAHAFDVTVVTPVPGKTSARDAFRRVTLSSTAPWPLAQHLRALQPERLLLGHAHPRLLLPAQMVAAGRYAVFTHGNDFLAAQKSWHRHLFNRLLAQANPLLTNSRANAQRLQTLGFPPPTVIYPGTDPARFTPPVRPPAAPTLLTLARLVPRKGIDTVLHTLPELRSTFPALRYQIGGNGPDRPRLEALAAKLGVTDMVTFLGFVPDETLPSLYQNATIFVMPAREETDAGSVEGFGIVFLEASASGLPVVASHSGGIEEAVQHGETGLLVSPDDPLALAAALQQLLSDPARGQRMGQAGRAWVETQMNWDRAGREMIAALQK